MNGAKPYLFTLLFAFAILWLSHTGCKKEYSYEGGDTTAIRHDTTTLPVVTSAPAVRFPPCSLCNENDSDKLNTWNFKSGNSYLCGGFTNAGFIGGAATTITFFGPSACSEDTGLVMTVYLPVSFDQDRVDITASEVAFFYYDNQATKDILISQPTAPFTVHIARYNNETRMATGTFYGTVFTANGDTAFINNGKFTVILK